MANAAQDEEERDDLDQVLEWIGFNTQAQRNSLIGELGGLSEFKDLSYKDIRSLAKSYAEMTVAEGRIRFGMTRTKRLMALTDWVTDCARVGEDPSIEGYDGESFLEALNESRARAEVRKVDEETMDSRAKEASPGMLTGENIWDKWETKLLNMLSILLGVFGVPLAYVIRETEEPEEGEEFGTFVEECIAKCPLEGPKFEADARKVHQIITSYTTGENAEQWIKPHQKEANGRVDMKALRDHYRGEGNQTRRISDAEKLRDTLHYKGESAMPFTTFLSKCQRMFNLFEQTKEPYTEAAKLRFLFEKIQNTELSPAVESLKAALVLDPDKYTFASASNHLAAQIKPRATRGLSAVQADSSSKSPIMKDGKIFTGFYKNWGSLSAEHKKLVIAERDRLGIKGDKSGRNKSKSLKAQVKSLGKKLEQQQAKIKALKRKEEDSSDSGDANSDEESANDAGNSFGGRSEKAKSKQSKKKAKK